MLHAIKLGDKQAMLTDESFGKQVVETESPNIPDGYKADWHWEETTKQLVQTWELKPVEGTANDAMLTLAKMQATTLSDDEALKVPALYDEWINGQTYVAGDRIRYKGVLYKCLQSHVSQADWTPDAAPSLWAKILPGQDGSDQEVGEWTQPDSANPYMAGDRVTYNGHLYESAMDNNVWSPTDYPQGWTDLGAYSA